MVAGDTVMVTADIKTESGVPLKGEVGKVESTFYTSVTVLFKKHGPLRLDSSEVRVVEPE